jgi:hypothetical protein
MHVGGAFLMVDLLPCSAIACMSTSVLTFDMHDGCLHWSENSLIRVVPVQHVRWPGCQRDSGSVELLALSKRLLQSKLAARLQCGLLAVTAAAAGNGVPPAQELLSQ